jgi:hypothetical protein
MTALRRRVRAVAFAWLLCQVASLSAFVPAECCAAHAAEAVAKEKAASCHEAAPKDGDACPMHHQSRAHDCCTITNGCAGPGIQLTGLFAFVGVIETPATSSVTLESAPATVAGAAPLLYRLTTPDSPPPKN